MAVTNKRHVNKYLEALFKNSLDAIVQIGPDHQIIDINQAFTELFGYDLEEIAGLHIDEVMNMGKKGTANLSLTDAILAGDKVIREGVRYNKWGQPIDVLIKGIPIIIEDKISGAYGIYANISDRKRAERELRERESKYNAIFEGSHDAVTIVSKDGYFLDCNRRALDLFGIQNKDEFYMTRPADFSPPFQADGRSSLEASREKVMEAFNCKEHIHFEWIHQRKNGGTFPAEVILLAYPLDGQTVLQGSVRDITVRKQAEKKLFYMSFHDTLTGKYNRSFLEEEMSRLDTERQLPISIIMADLNGLKLVNDTYGHHTGDQVLKKAADIIEQSCRREDIIARWGGDEFVIFLPRTPAKAALSLCRRISNNCSSTFIEDIPVSLALGVSTKTSSQINLTEVLKKAEDSMYKQKLTESRSTKSGLLKALLKTLAEKSFETEAHTRRMQDIAQRIGRFVKLPDTELNRLNLLITLHDIGKINISEEILTKNGPLTADEWEIIKKHPEIGYRIARATEEFTHVAEGILSHHERWDGTGYPRGLKGEEIPLLARIVTVADAFEVMSYGRPYKKALTPEQIQAEYEKQAGRQFDPDLVEILLSEEMF